LLALGIGCGAAPQSAAPRPGYAIEPTVPLAETREEKTEAAGQPSVGGESVQTDTSVEPSTKKSPPPPPPSTTTPSAGRPPVAPTPGPSQPTTAPPPTAKPAARSAEPVYVDAAKEAPGPHVESKVVNDAPIVTGAAGGASMPPASILPGPPAIQIAAAQANFEEASRQLAGATGDCARLCKALASMQRATERLCGLVASGSDSEKRRCVDARAKLTAATAKVTAACGVCSNP
jgi:hypothetical protein